MNVVSGMCLGAAVCTSWLYLDQAEAVVITLLAVAIFASWLDAKVD